MDDIVVTGKRLSEVNWLDAGGGSFGFWGGLASGQSGYGGYSGGGGPFLSVGDLPVDDDVTYSEDVSEDIVVVGERMTQEEMNVYDGWHARAASRRSSSVISNSGRSRPSASAEEPPARSPVCFRASPGTTSGATSVRRP